MYAIVTAVRPMHFGIVLGIGGLGSGWREAARLWGLPAIVGETLSLAAVAIWLLLLLLYLARWIAHPHATRAELAHPVQALLGALIPVATLIASIALAPLAPAVALGLCLVGLAGVLLFAAWGVGDLWLGERALEATTPILYMPTVGGGLVAAIACGTLQMPGAGWMFFGLGLMSFMAMESVFLSRLLHKRLPTELRATLGMHLAPPAVACVAYLALDRTPHSDPAALALFGYACFLALVMLRLVPWLREQPFGPGAWAYTFGVSALPLAALQLAGRGAGEPVTTLALLLFVGANLVIGWIALRSLLLLARTVAAPR